MSAPEFDELLSAYLDGEVTAEERALVERRLEQSPALRETLDEYSDVSEAVRGLPRPGAPVDLPERVLARLRSRESRPRVAAKGAGALETGPSRRRSWMLGGTVAAATGVLLTTGLLWRGGNAPLVGPNIAMDARSKLDARTPASAATLSAPAESDERVGFGTARSWSEVERDRESQSLQELQDLIAHLQRQPMASEVLRILENNGSQIDVVEFSVVDVQEMNGFTKTLLAKNGLALMEVETPTVVDAPASAAKNKYFAFYVEGEDSRIEQTLEELQQKAPNAVDYGPLGDVSGIAESRAVTSEVENVPAAETVSKSSSALNERPADPAAAARKPAESAPIGVVAEAGQDKKEAESKGLVQTDRSKSEESVAEKTAASAEAPAAPVPVKEAVDFAERDFLKAQTGSGRDESQSVSARGRSVELPEAAVKQVQQMVQNRSGRGQQYNQLNRSRYASPKSKSDGAGAPMAGDSNRRLLLIFQTAEAAAEQAGSLPAAEPAKN